MFHDSVPQVSPGDRIEAAQWEAMRLALRRPTTGEGVTITPIGVSFSRGVGGGGDAKQQWINAGSTTCPAYGVIRVVEECTRTGDDVLLKGTNSFTYHRLNAINGPTEVEVDSQGTCITSGLAWVALESALEAEDKGKLIRPNASTSWYGTPSTPSTSAGWRMLGDSVPNDDDEDAGSPHRVPVWIEPIRPILSQKFLASDITSSGTYLRSTGAAGPYWNIWSATVAEPYNHTSFNTLGGTFRVAVNASIRYKNVDVSSAAQSTTATIKLYVNDVAVIGTDWSPPEAVGYIHAFHDWRDPPGSGGRVQPPTAITLTSVGHLYKGDTLKVWAECYDVETAYIEQASIAIQGLQ